MKKIYIFAGKARHGKDSCADFIKDYYKDRVEHESFAKTLKEQCLMLGWDGNKDEKGRSFLQKQGDVLKAYHGQDYFARECAERIRKSDKDVFVITDMRFKTEMKFWVKLRKEFDVYFIKVVRPNFESELTELQKNHISEVDLDDVEFKNIVINDGQYEDLKLKVIKGIERDWKKESSPRHEIPETDYSNRHNQNNRPIIGLDFDDVIGNFLGTVCHIYNEEHPGTNISIRDFKEWSLLSNKKVNEDILEIFRRPGFFESMPQKKRSVRVIKELIESKKYDVYIITACQSVTELQEKVNWMANALPTFNPDRIIKCKDKEIVRLDVLVDDNVENLKKCSKYMNCIVYDMPHNRSCEEFRRIKGLKELPDILEELFGITY